MMSVAPHPEITHVPAAEGARELTRVLVVDDHPAVRAGLCALLDDEPDLEVVAAVARAEEALWIVEHEPVGVAVIDYQLGSRNGLWLSRRLKRLPSPPAVLIYSAYADGVLAAAAVVAEADGILHKGSLGLALCDEIRLVAHGGRSRVAPLPGWLGDAVRARLGHDEQAIFGMLLAGIDKQEIAEVLGLTAADLNGRMGAMVRKLDGPLSAPVAPGWG